MSIDRAGRRAWWRRNVAPIYELSGEYCNAFGLLPFGAVEYGFHRGLIPPERLTREIDWLIDDRTAREMELGHDPKFHMSDYFRREYARVSTKGRSRIDKQLSIVRLFARTFGYIERGTWRDVHEAHERQEAERREAKRWQREQAKRRAAMAPIRHQQKRLREGKAAMVAIRKHLRDQQQSQRQASATATTTLIFSAHSSPTSSRAR